MNRTALTERIRTLSGLTDAERADLLTLLNEQKTYGLTWEAKPEQVEEDLRASLPILREIAERRIMARSAATEIDSVKERTSETMDGQQLKLDLSATVSDSPADSLIQPFAHSLIDTPAPHHLLIEGDNLHALTVLNYTHAGRVDVIYIDPPYNTGNRDFKYNDRFVDREDSYRHSKWLSFMHKRLTLARSLLKPEGVIFISIDDNEQAQLKLLCDQVFGEARFIGNFIWKSRQNKDNRNVTGASIDHEYVVCYGNKLRGSQRDLSQYSNPDNDSRGDWTSSNMVGLATADKRPNLHYDLLMRE